MKFLNCLTLVSVLFIATTQLKAEVLDRVIATIGSEPVTLLEVKGLLKNKSATPIEGVPSEMDIKEALLVLLFSREASRLGVAITEDDINEYIRRVEISNGGEVGNIEVALSAQGMTLEAYKEKVKLELEKSRVLAMNIRGQVQVSDEEVERYLGKEQINEKSDGFYLAQVYHPKDLSSEDLEKIKNFLKDNKKCFSMQEIKAKCINMGEVQVKELKEDIKDLVEDLDLYEIGKSNATDDSDQGVLYMRVEANFGDESGETFSKVKEQIYQKKFMEKASEFVDKEIFEKYAVEIY